MMKKTLLLVFSVASVLAAVGCKAGGDDGAAAPLPKNVSAAGMTSKGGPGKMQSAPPPASQ